MKVQDKFLAVVLCGAFLAAFPSLAQAKRLHDPQVTTKVEMQQNISAGDMTRSLPDRVSSGLRNDEPTTFSERVQAILHPPVEMKPQIIAPPAPVAEDAILGGPLATEEQCVKYLLSVNPNPDITVSPKELVSYYYKEGEREGVRPDVAFAQALKETGFFRYGGTVTPDQNNYCGLGTTSAVVKGAYFPSSQLGVRAHIQHLLAYASTRRPLEPVVDPRYDLVRSVYGDDTLGRWEDLNGRWAVPGYTYGQSILAMFNAILRQ